MADLPELTHSVQRKLALQWSTVLDQYHMTGEHLHWHERQAYRAHRIHAQNGSTLIPGPRPTSRAFDHIGITQSSAVAERRFNDLAREYFQFWYSSAAGYETFVEWLDIIKGRALADLASVWEGGSEIVLAWYRRACVPAVKKGLDSLVKQNIRQARGTELQRLERTCLYPQKTGFGPA